MTRINAVIRDEDKEWLRQHDIGITELINTAIFIRKSEVEGFSPNFQQEREKRQLFQLKFTRALRFIEEKGFIEEFLKRESKND